MYTAFYSDVIEVYIVTSIVCQRIDINNKVQNECGLFATMGRVDEWLIQSILMCQTTLTNVQSAKKREHLIINLPQIISTVFINKHIEILWEIKNNNTKGKWTSITRSFQQRKNYRNRNFLSKDMCGHIVRKHTSKLFLSLLEVSG